MSGGGCILGLRLRILKDNGASTCENVSNLYLPSGSLGRFFGATKFNIWGEN